MILLLMTLCGTDTLKQYISADASQAVYTGYRRAVNTLCDDALKSPEPNWRHPYHALYIDYVQATSLQLATKQNFKLSCLTSTGCSVTPPGDPVSVNSSPITCGTPLSATSSGTSSSYNSFASATSDASLSSIKSSTSAASTGSSSSSNSFFSTTSSCTAVSPASSLSQDSKIGTNGMWTWPSTPTSVESNSLSSPGESPSSMQPPRGKMLTYCPSCNKPFKGSAQNRASNLKRHRKTVHHEGELLSCAEPGCEKVCGRSDNLRKHRWTAHNIRDPVKQPSSSKRRRKCPIPLTNVPWLLHGADCDCSQCYS